MSRENGDNSTNRRKVLKVTAGLATMPGITGLGGAVTETRTRLERIVDEAHRILEQTDDREKYLNFLDKRANADWIRRTYSIQKDDGVSGEKIDRGELDISMAITGGCGDDMYYVDLAWNYDSAYTESPDDVAALIWDHNWWDLYYPDSYNDSFRAGDNVSYREGTFSGQGPGFNVEDWAVLDSQIYCGAFITPLGDYSSTQRRVYARYTHTWNQVDIQSVGVGISAAGPALTVTLSDNTKKWQTDSEQDGDTPLYVHQNDVSC